MKAIELLRKLESKPVFRVQDIERICLCERSYAKIILHRLKEKGLIKKVTRNVYTTKDDIWVVASNIAIPCYISFWSASYFFGYTEQIVNTIQLATTFRKNPINFEGYTIKFIPIKEFFGFKKIRTENGDVFMVEPEKLLIDAFLKPEECGNFGEILKIYENAEISEEKVVGYLKKVNKQSIIKRAGYLLEKIRGIDISDNFELDRNYVILDLFSQRWKKINSKWRVKI
jgi:predicted transcriptional regulator of viral defense system